MTRAEYARTYRQTHREQYNEYQRNYYQRNKKTICQKRKTTAQAKAEAEGRVRVPHDRAYRTMYAKRYASSVSRYVRDDVQILSDVIAYLIEECGTYGQQNRT